MTKIVTISDTHSQHEAINVPEDADIVIHAGDCTSRGKAVEIEAFLSWYGNLPNKHKILIAGNHDWGFESNWDRFADMAKANGIHLLYDTSVTVEGLKIWGSPVQPEFCNWAFNRSRTIEDSMSEQGQKYGHAFIGNHWDKIPEDADIIVTHGPVYGILDKTFYGNENVGCELLARHVKRIKPIMHISGHIHEERGVYINYSEDSNTTYVNASSLDLQYTPYKSDTYVFDLDKLKKGISYGKD